MDYFIFYTDVRKPYKLKRLGLFGRALFTDIRPRQKSAQYLRSCAHDQAYKRVFDALSNA